MFTSQFTPYSFPLLGLVRLPSVTISPEDRAKINVKPGSNNITFIKKLAWSSYLEMKKTGEFDDIPEKDVIDRLRFECSVLEKTGTVDYILMVWDICRWCDKEGIPRGPGRGSVCGSLVCFLLQITDTVNPLRYNLSFTRFISETRVKPKIVDGVTYADGRSMCDIDGDFSADRYKEVLSYIESQYPNRTAKIGTMTTLTGKTALKDVLKVYLEWDETHAKAVTDRIEAKFGKVEKLSEAEKDNKDYKAWLEESPNHKRAHTIAKSLQGLITHKGVHASGFFLCYDTIDNTLPVERIIDKEGEEHIATSFEMDQVAQIGVKLDILKLKALDAIKKTCDMIGVKAKQININESDIYDFLEKSRYYNGVFQVDVGLAGDATHKAKPKNIKQLSATISIARPGSLKEIPTLVKYYETGEMKHIYPSIDEILKDTANVIIYQEQINEICQKVYGLNPDDAEEVSRAIRKKKREDIKKWEVIIVEQGKKLDVPTEVTDGFWSTCNASADYLFSVNHGLPYAVLTARTTWLKAKYLKEFYLGLLETVKKEKMSEIINEAAKLGVRILPPSVIHSDEGFKFEGNDIRFGLKHIKGIAAANLIKVSSFRRDFKNKIEVFDFAKQLGLQINVVETLFWSGAMNVDNTPRLKLAMEARAYNLMSDTQRDIIARYAGDYGFDLMETIRALKELKNEKGKPMLNEKQLDRFRRDFRPHWDMWTHNAKYEDLFSYLAERNLLGFSYSNSLFNLFSKKVEGLIPVAEVLTEPKGAEVSFVAFVDEVKKAIGKQSKKPYFKMDMSDESGQIKSMINGQTKIDACLQFNTSLPEENDIVIIHGRKAEGSDMVFAESVVIQRTPIKLKTSNAKMD